MNAITRLTLLITWALMLPTMAQADTGLLNPNDEVARLESTSPATDDRFDCKHDAAGDGSLAPVGGADTAVLAYLH